MAFPAGRNLCFVTLKVCTRKTAPTGELNRHKLQGVMQEGKQLFISSALMLSSDDSVRAERRSSMKGFGGGEQTFPPFSELVWSPASPSNFENPQIWFVWSFFFFF